MGAVALAAAGVVGPVASAQVVPVPAALSSPVPALGRPGAAAALPRLGEAGALDLAAERQLGDRIAAQLLQSPDHWDDPVLGDYLMAIWQPLVATARRSGDLADDLHERFAWRLFLMRERSINAFALPGGYLGVHLGLVAAAARPDELASVLAHELSHVSQRHISRMLAQQDRQAPWIVGAMILGALAASASKNADIAQAAVVGGQAVAVQSQLNFSRDMEREADRVGYGVMTGAGFDGLGFVTLFETLQQAARLNDDGAFPYLRSHPLTTERMADMRSRLLLNPSAGASAQPPLADGGAAATPPAEARPGPPVSAAWHGLMRMRARVMAETDQARLQALLALEPAEAAAAAAPAARGGARVAGHSSAADAAELASPLERAYAAALAAHRLRHHEDALKRARHLQSHHGATPGAEPAVQQTLDLLVLELALATDATLAQLPAADALRALKGKRAAVMLGAQAAVRMGQAKAASDRLQTWVTLDPEDALAWAVLAQAWAAQGQPLRAIRAEAESRRALLDLSGAVDRLRAARELGARMSAPDHVELSIIDARYRSLSQRLREQLLDERAKP